MYSPDSPASMSIHEEATVFAEGPMMGVFNNLVMFDQHVPQNSLQSIVPDLATGWSWNEEGTELTLPLREGVTWHDGKPFTAYRRIGRLETSMRRKIALKPGIWGMSLDNVFWRAVSVTTGYFLSKSRERL
jgi:Bacterial extracellular solute-binding proteins, family 5 Middle